MKADPQAVLTGTHFIDGDHAYAAVLRDCRVCEKLLKPGGRLCGHDYSRQTNVDVVRAVDELYGRRLVVAETIWQRV